jgi:16S rRNA (cytosine967-C5)-methyltransferase
MNLSTLFFHAIELYRATLAVKRPADYSIAGYFKRQRDLDMAAKKFLSETVYDALRRGIYFNEIIRAATVAINFPARLSDYGLFFLCALTTDSFSRTELTRIFSQMTKLAERKFNDLVDFYNEHKELDYIVDDDLGRFSVRHAFPRWISAALQPIFAPGEMALLFDRLNSAPPLCLRVNSYKTSVGALERILQDEQTIAHRGELSPFALIVDERKDLFNLKSFRDGLFEVQDEGSQLISLLLDPKPNARVLDACAGAGGKTLHLGALMKGRGELFAFDTDARRLAKIDKRIQRAGLQNIRALNTAASFQRFKAGYFGKLDGLLIDAPCSGIGSVRRAPDIKLHASPQLVDAMNKKQQEILNTFCAYLKPGGRLVYATCSILPAENIDIVERFLAENRNFKLKPIYQALNEMKVDYDAAKLREIFADAEMLQLYPHIHGCDGFFAAILEKQRE